MLIPTKKDNPFIQSKVLLALQNKMRLTVFFTVRQVVEQCRPHKDAKQSVKLLLCSTPDNEGFPSTPRSLSLSQLHQVCPEQEMNMMGTQGAILPTCIGSSI